MTDFLFNASIALYTSSLDGGRWLPLKERHSLFSYDELEKAILQECSGMGMIRVTCEPHRGYIAPFKLRDFMIYAGVIRYQYMHDNDNY
jgi:hypothetical protein